MLIPLLDSATGALPVGRYQASVDELHSTFVEGKAPVREKVWNDWQQATAFLRRHVPVAAAWLGGSFFTNKDEPDDIDCVYWVDYMDLNAARFNAESARVIEIFAGQRKLRDLVGLQVDTFVVAWFCCPDVSQAMPDTRSYWQSRGQWDDFWSRMRTGTKGAPAVRDDALPRRGYLEVTFDGFK